VLYVTDSQEIMRKLARVLEKPLGLLGPNPSKEKFLCVSLIDLLSPENCSTALEKNITNNRKDITHE
jgi:hypothetical protein